MKKRVAVIGSGLCGSVVAALLRNDFQVTVIEQSKKQKPLFDDVDCPTGELNTSINRGQGLGGTTNYWHNALIELDDHDLGKAGIKPSTMRSYYDQAWSFFLNDRELADCNRARDNNKSSFETEQCKVAHMVLPQTRHNVWNLANKKYPGDSIDVVYGHAKRIDAKAGFVELDNGQRVEADKFVVAAGGLGTPVLLAQSLGNTTGFCPGYHDHPMAYVAKVRLSPNSRLKHVTSSTLAAEVRAGLVYTNDDLKTVIYLRPAIDMRLSSITGPARYILSDLRNDPFSPKKIMMLLGNLEAVREAILFKTRLGFRGDYFSILILGEQTPLKERGVKMNGGRKPSLNWEVTPQELASYNASVEDFFKEFSSDILEKKVIPVKDWAFRNAAHHSGTANQFVPAQQDANLPFFAAKDLPNTYVCDGSILRAAGIANSGLTLVALSYRLAELMRA